MFLTAAGRLTESLEWQALTPLRNGGLLEGVARLPGQLLGTQPSTPSTTEAALNARDTSDLLRRFRELGKRMKQEYGNSVPHLSDAEDSLRVRHCCVRSSCCASFNPDQTSCPKLVQIKRQDIEAYTSKLVAASRKAEHLVKEFETHAAGLFALCLFIVALLYSVQDGRAEQLYVTNKSIGPQLWGTLGCRLSSLLTLRKLKALEQERTPILELTPVGQQLSRGGLERYVNVCLVHWGRADPVMIASVGVNIERGSLTMSR